MKQQQGFAHAILIIVLVVALLGALGYIFWQNFTNKSEDSAVETTQNALNSNTQNSAENDEAYEGVYTTGGNYKVKIPNGFSVQTGPYNTVDSDDSFIVMLAGPNQLDSLQYDKEAQPEINTLPGFGWDGLTEHFYMMSQEGIARDFSQYTKSTFTLQEGTKGSKYVKTLQKEDQKGYDSFQKEADSYTFSTYSFEKEGVRVFVDLNYYSNTKFDLDLGEDVIRSIKFE